MVAHSSFPCNKAGLLAFLEAMKDINPETLGYLLDHFGSVLGDLRDLIVASLPEPDLFFSCLADNEMHELIYTKCYFPASNSVAVSYDLAAFLRASQTRNIGIWNYFLADHFYALHDAEKADMVTLLETLDLNIEMPSNDFWNQRPEAQTQSLLEIASQAYLETVKKMVTIEDILRLLAHFNHISYKSMIKPVSAKAKTAQYMTLYILQYLDLFIHSEIRTCFDISEDVLSLLISEAITRYKTDSVFFERTNRNIDAVEEMLDNI